MTDQENFDVVIVGGSYAGLSAAMALGRAMRNVLIIDSGKPCNIQTPHAHNFVTHDGETPYAITLAAKNQVLAYPTIEFLHDTAISVTGINNHFEITTETNKIFSAKKILFATGIKDCMPDIPGFSEAWGISVIHCPYCHGYEFRGQNTGILANGEMVFEFCKLINHWTKKLTIFTNGPATFNQEIHNKLTDLNITIVENEVKRIEHDEGNIKNLIFADQSSCELDALYARIPFEQHSKIPEIMGCTITEAGYIQIDEFQKTSVPGIFAAGDNTTMFRALTMALSAGSKAGAIINHELISES